MSLFRLFIAAAAALAGDQVTAMGRTCGDCYKPFRKPKEESYKNR